MKRLDAVSVVIPTYNRAHLIDRAIHSALSQLLPGDEIIVVDDGSTDNTEAVVKPHEPLVRYVRSPNGGAGRARNRGVELASNPLIAFLDSDDEWMPGSLYLRRSVMAAMPDVVFAFSDFAVRDRDKVEYRHYLPRWHNDPRPWSQILGPPSAFSLLSEVPASQPDFPVYAGDLYLSELTANYVFTSTLLVRKNAAGTSLHFGEDMPTYEDWLCFGLLSRTGPAAYLDCETAWQHDHPGPRLNGSDDVRTADARLIVVRGVWGQDAEFLKIHGEEYRRVLAANRLVRAKRLVKAGRTAEARAELASLHDAPQVYRAIAALPGPLVAAAMGAVRLVRSALGGRS